MMAGNASVPPASATPLAGGPALRAGIPLACAHPRAIPTAASGRPRDGSGAAGIRAATAAAANDHPISRKSAALGCKLGSQAVRAGRLSRGHRAPDRRATGAIRALRRAKPARYPAPDDAPLRGVARVWPAFSFWGPPPVATWFEPAVIDLTVPASLLYATWVLTRRPSLPIRLPALGRLSRLRQSAARLAQAATRQGRHLHRLVRGWPGTVGDGGGRAAAHLDPRHDRRGQDDGNFKPALECPRARLGLRAGGRQGPSRPVRQGAGAGPPLRPRGRRARAELHGGVRGEGQRPLQSVRHRQRRRHPRIAGEPVRRSGAERSQRRVPRARGRSRRHDRARAGLAARPQGHFAQHRDHPLQHRTALDLEARHGEEGCCCAIRTTGTTRELDVSGEIPEDVTWPLRAYLGELPGYDPTLPLDKQKGDEPSKQHGFAQFYFTATFTQLAVSLGHIFRVENGEIDMRDIVLNRRILVVNLPALENSDATLAALGKLVVASLRGMMAQLLGASLEGDYSEADKPGMGSAPFPVVLDELAYYATSGLDRMLAMGRGLNISFMLGFQETSGIWARLGEKTASLLGNANFTIAMRQQDSGRTREWLAEDRRRDLRHASDLLPGIGGRRLSGGAPRRSAAGLAGRLAGSHVADRGRGDRAVRRPAGLCARVPRRHRR